MTHLTHRRRARRGPLLAASLAAVTLLAAACGGGGDTGGQAASGSDTGGQSSSIPAMPSSSASSGSQSSSMPASPSSSASSGGPEGGTIMIAGEKVNDHGTKTVTGMSSVNVEMDDFYFEPSVLRGEPGQKITVQLTNEGKAAHTFTLPGQDVDTVVPPGQKGTVMITFPAQTTLFTCRFHAQAGMRGALETAGG